MCSCSLDFFELWPSPAAREQNTPLLERKFIEINGRVKKIHYLELGQGDPLILVHGGLSHSSEWINILKPLSAHFNLFVVDRPGHGLSDATCISAR